MPDNTNQTPRSQREIASHIEEEDLWELDDDWGDEASSEAAPAPAPSSPAAPAAPAADSPATEPPKPEETEPVQAVQPEEVVPEVIEPSPEPPTESSDTFETEDILDQEIETAPLEADSTTIDKNEEQAVSYSTPPPAEEDIAETTAATDTEVQKSPSSKGLSIVEKASLGVVALCLLGLAVYGYIWLYNKNQTEQTSKLTFPVTGDHVSIADFSTYWTTAKSSHEIKIGAAVLPAAQITLDDSTTSGALRLYFRNVENVIVGDPITLTIRDGVFSDTAKSNITVSDNGRTATIVASDGFHQEGDYSAYVLDKTLAWKVFVFEAGDANASGSAFQEIIETKVDPRRQ